MIRPTLLLLVAIATVAAASPNEIYVVSPKATEATKAAVAAGRPPEDGFPEIHDVTWTTTHIKPGGTIEASVTTSTNVTYVEGRYKNWNFVFNRVALGRFHVAMKVPFFPPFILGNREIDVIARSLDGVEVRRPFNFSFSY